jgi:hypothetical protein
MKQSHLLLRISAWLRAAGTFHAASCYACEAVGLLTGVMADANARHGLRA